MKSKFLAVNGAFQAPNDGENDDPPGLGAGIDVGSPGTAIPEPGVVALFGLSALVLHLLRRHRRA